MDAVDFAKRGLDELKSRLAQIDNIQDQSSANFGVTPEKVVEKFFADQGMNFGTIDTQAVLALVGTEPTQEPMQQVQEDAAIADEPVQNG